MNASFVPSLCSWAILFALAGCAGPTHVFDASESPVFLGENELLTLRYEGQEINVRHIEPGLVRLSRSWAGEVEPAGRKVHYDFVARRIQISGPGVDADRVESRDFGKRTSEEPEWRVIHPPGVFSLWSWPEADHLGTRRVDPGLDLSTEGARVLRRAPAAHFEIYNTATQDVTYGPLLEKSPADPEASEAWTASVARDPLSSGRLLPEGRVVYSWRGRVLLATPSAEGGTFAVKDLGAGDLVEIEGERLFVLRGRETLRALDIETGDLLWEAEVSGLEGVSESAEAIRPWKLLLSPKHGAVALTSGVGFLVVAASSGEVLMPPTPVDSGQIALGVGRCAAYDSKTFEVRVWNYGDSAPIFRWAFDDPGAPLRGLSLSHQGDWLAVSVGSEVQVWNLRDDPPR